MQVAVCDVHCHRGTTFHTFCSEWLALCSFLVFHNALLTLLWYPVAWIPPSVLLSWPRKQFISFLAGRYCLFKLFQIVFHLLVLHPVVHLSNWFPMTPSIATKFQYINSPFIFTHYMFRPLRAIFGWGIQLDIFKDYFYYNGSVVRTQFDVEMLYVLHRYLEDRPDHHEEIQSPTHLDILTFYIWDLFSWRILMILQFLYLY
jgi:hypothetical protein